jgi:2-succinyl-5-enolpyruvyl-6-hydroxy-3-cyclohexene-1-carboxylate synthase
MTVGHAGVVAGRSGDRIRGVNPSSALAQVLVDELVRHGVRDVVLCPGSRSAPLAYAVQEAERSGRLRLHVRVDERSAGFLALGLAKASRMPAAVVTTSGTAVANLHPAVLEAHHGVVPLIVLSADRPPELRGTGANQTTTQPGIFGGAVRWSHELGVAEARTGQVPGWRATVARAVAAAVGSLGGIPGPVHLNVPLREPLVPTHGDWPEPLDGRPDGRPWTALPGSAGADPRPAYPRPADPRPVATAGLPGDSWRGGRRTLVVLGDLPRPAQSDVAVQWAARRGWPVVAEPFGDPVRRGPGSRVVPHGSLLLTCSEWLDAHQPERVVTVGRVTLSRAVAALLRRPGVRVENVTPIPQWADPSAVVAEVHPWSVVTQSGSETASPGRGIDDSWAAAWQDAGNAVAKAVVAEGLPWPTGLGVASTVVTSLPSGAALFVGSSNAVRDLDLAAAEWADDVAVYANRGLAGIDGCVSTAAGVALGGDRPAYALVGDLTFLHDTNGLLIGPREPHPDLTIVVANDDGGGIFTLLEPGEPKRAADFERVFGTPTGVDLDALCRAHGVGHVLATSPEALAEAVSARPAGIHVVEVRIDRTGHRAAHARLRQIAVTALAPLTPRSADRP